MAEKGEEPVTLFTNPTLTLLEVKMKILYAMRVVGNFFAPPKASRKTNPAPEPQRTPNKLKKTKEHYHLIRASNMEDGDDVCTHMPN